jgi:sn-glycerol 3-phosphate transport system ATP-binding protein
MGRALVREPQVFLFDEPLSNLDAALRGQMRIEIRQLQRTLKITSVFVTHDQIEAMTMADRLAVMNQGRLEQFGTPLEIYHRPATQFVASFIGSPPMNFLAPSLLPIPLPKETVTVGVRPEHLTPEGAHRLPIGQCVLIEELGSEAIVHGQLPEQQTILVRVAGDHRRMIGDTVDVGFEAHHVHCFDAQGRRLEF